ncbi:MAG: hypothetical protein M1819_000131 [Sarea resinae]|nr:MAG: hypothetical protein M1819_000131 [Sarea resinae]
MGCCQSSSRSQRSRSPYPPSIGPGDSSSRAAITSDTSGVVPPADTLPPSSGISRDHSSSGRRRRRLALGEHFNRPLQRHVWSSAAGSSISEDGSNKRRVWTREELEKERIEFFETRVSGRPEIWRVLRTVVEMMGTSVGGGAGNEDLATAQGILDAAAVTVPTGDLVNGAYDEFGNFYQMPEQIVADPVNVATGGSASGSAPSGDRLRYGRGAEATIADDSLREDSIGKGDQEDEEEVEIERERRREEKGKDVLHTLETLSVKARLSDRGGRDVRVLLGKEQKVRVLVRKVQEEIQIPGCKLRIAYMGRILNEGETLQAQGWKEGHVVNAMILQ